MCCLLECALARCTLPVKMLTFMRPHWRRLHWLSLCIICRSITTYAPKPRRRMERSKNNKVLSTRFHFIIIILLSSFHPWLRIISHMKSSNCWPPLSRSHNCITTLALSAITTNPVDSTASMVDVERSAERHKKKTCSSSSTWFVLVFVFVYASTATASLWQCISTTDANTHACIHNPRYKAGRTTRIEKKSNVWSVERRKKKAALGSCTARRLLLPLTYSRALLFSSNVYWAGSHLYIYSRRQIYSFVHSTSGGFWR